MGGKYNTPDGYKEIDHEFLRHLRILMEDYGIKGFVDKHGRITSRSSLHSEKRKLRNG